MFQRGLLNKGKNGFYNGYDLLQLLPVQLSPTISQPRSSLLGSDISLRLRHQLVSDQELPDRGASEKWRIEVHVEVGCVDLLFRTFKGRLVDSRAWKRGCK